jgi:hypothetical protein
MRGVSKTEMQISGKFFQDEHCNLTLVGAQKVDFQWYDCDIFSLELEDPAVLGYGLKPIICVL